MLGRRKREAVRNGVLVGIGRRLRPRATWEYKSHRRDQQVATK
jgi:hypothetical protein